MTLTDKPITQQCKHEIITFNSGGYYAVCKQCDQTWVAVQRPHKSDQDFGYTGAFLTHTDERRAPAARHIKEEK